MCPVPRWHLESRVRTQKHHLHALPRRHHHAAGPEQEFGFGVRSLFAGLGRQPHLRGLPAWILLTRRERNAAEAPDLRCMVSTRLLAYPSMCTHEACMPGLQLELTSSAEVLATARPSVIRSENESPSLKL